MARKSRKAAESEVGVIEQSPQTKIFATAIYARLSVENSGKDDDGAALENQIDVCREYIKSCPYLNLVRVYSDNGRTGTVFDRPAFNQMMDDVRSGAIDCLVVRDLSRFGRDYVETGTYIERIFPQLDVRFISVKERFDSFATDGSNESLMIPLSNLINDLYSKDISRKVSAAVRIQMENGEFHWRKIPYGYKWNDDKTSIIPDERTARYVRDIFKWKIEGMSMETILEQLDNAGALIPETLQRNSNLDRINTTTWCKITVFGILKNPVYVGDFAVGRTRFAIYAGIKNQQIKDKSKWYITRDAHEGLVSRADFEAVQEIMSKASNARRDCMIKSQGHRDELIDFFDKKVFCADCGKRMYFHRKEVDNRKVKNKRDDWYAFYECSTSVSKRNIKCGRHYTRQDKLNEYVLNALKLHIQIALDYDELISKLRENNADKRLRNQMNAAINSVNLKLRGIAGKRERLYEDFVGGILNEGEYAYAKSAYDKTWEELNLQMDELISHRNSYNEAMSPDNKWSRLMKGLPETETLTQELVDAAIDKILIHTDKTIELFMKYHDIYELTGQYLHQLGEKDGAIE